MPQWTPKPPLSNPDTREYWEACRRHELRLQRCRNCRAWHHFPRTLCPECWSESVALEPVAGRGTVSMFTRLGPNVVAWVDLADQDGLRTVANIVECDPDEVRIGLEVEPVWQDFDDFSLPQFRPA